MPKKKSKTFIEYELNKRPEIMSHFVKPDFSTDHPELWEQVYLFTCWLQSRGKTNSEVFQEIVDGYSYETARMWIDWQSPEVQNEVAKFVFGPNARQIKSSK